MGYIIPLPASLDRRKIHTNMNRAWAAGQKRDPNPRIRRLSRNQAICRASSTVKVRRTISAG